MEYTFVASWNVIRMDKTIKADFHERKFFSWKEWTGKELTGKFPLSCKLSGTTNDFKKIKKSNFVPQEKDI